MYKYEELGLINSNVMLKDAYAGKYAIPALNFISIEQLNAICDAMISKNSPVMLLVSPNLHRQLGSEMIARLAQATVDRIKHSGKHCRLALHLDHGMTYEQCVHAISTGFSSVMIDGSALPFEENVALTQKVVEYAHAHDVTVEGELGVLSGVEESITEGSQHEARYTNPLMVKRFVEETGVDCLAISIGTSHGLVKMKPNPDGSLPRLRFDILDEIESLIPGFPIVLHGASAIKREYIKMINEYGGVVQRLLGFQKNKFQRLQEKLSARLILLPMVGFLH